MNGMSETNKVVLSAILGIIIGFGFGRFSSDRQSPVAGGIGEEATSTTSVSNSEPASTVAGEGQAPSGATESPAQSQAAAVSVITEEVSGNMGSVQQQTSKTSAVSALDQKAGKSVNTVVSLDRKGWVAVHEQTDGKPGKILGAKHFGPATAFFSVPLQRATVAGRTYYVMLHSDDGDINDFSLTRDLPLLGANAMPIMGMFNAL